MRRRVLEPDPRLSDPVFLASRLRKLGPLMGSRAEEEIVAAAVLLDTLPPVPPYELFERET